MPTREEIIAKAKEINKEKTKERTLKYKKLAKFLLNKGLRTKEATCFAARISYFRCIYHFLHFLIFLHCFLIKKQKS